MDATHQPRCPKCGMELLAFSFERLRLDQCAHCEGLWLDPGELDRLTHGHPRPLQSLELDRKRVFALERERELTPEAVHALAALYHLSCPRCAEPLVEEGFHGLRIDRCASCHGAWLDAGELEQVMGAEHGLLRALRKVFEGSARTGIPLA